MDSGLMKEREQHNTKEGVTCKGAGAENVSTSLKRKFEKRIELRQQLLLSNIIINYGIRKLHFKVSTQTIIYVTFILAILLYIITTLLSILFGESAPVFTFAFLASFLTAFSFGVIKYLDHHILSVSFDAFPKNLVDFALDNKSLAALSNWLRSYLSLEKQLVVSSIIGILGTASTFYIAKNRSMNFKFGSYILIFCCFFAIGHGAYCAVIIPTLAKVLSQKRMKMFWLNPADSSWVNDASSFFTKLSMADALIVAFVIGGLYLLKPWESSKTAWVAGIWLVIGIACLSYTFLYPHYYLNKAIKSEKKRQMENLQTIIRTYQTRVEGLNKSEFKDLFERIKLYDHLSAAKESAVDTQALLRFITSIIVPSLTYLGGFLSKR
jgi:hypothetical protein